MGQRRAPHRESLVRARQTYIVSIHAHRVCVARDILRYVPSVCVYQRILDDCGNSKWHSCSKEMEKIEVSNNNLKL